MYDIITFGSVTKDIFIKTKKIKVIKSKDFITGKGVCFNLGSKVDIDEILFTSGGGGTNTAVTFANQGFKVAYCGAVGDDLAGREIVNDLAGFGVDTQFIVKSKDKPTNHSIVIGGANSDRTILVYKGASEELTKENIPWDKLETKWFYIAPLTGLSCPPTKVFAKTSSGGVNATLFEELVNFAYENNIRVALNPGNCQLSLPKETLRRILKKVDILILNQEEASSLTKIPFQKEKEIFKKIDEICPGIAIMTKGEKGAVVSDGKNIYSAPSLPARVVDRTGAGDAFSSGFVSGYLRFNRDILSSLQLGIANAVACLKTVGAKNDLLKKSEEFDKVKVKIYPVK